MSKVLAALDDRVLTFTVPRLALGLLVGLSWSCAAKEEDAACAPGYGTLGLSTEPGNAYAESVWDTFEADMRLAMDRMTEEVESCEGFDYRSSESVVVVDHKLEFTDEYAVPAGQYCGDTYGRQSLAEGHGVIECSGTAELVVVSECERGDTTVLINCYLNVYDEGV